MFVPLFVQGVLGGSATSSGLVLTPLMLAMMATSVGSGQVITRTGRYRWALLAGPVVMGAGFALLSLLDAGSTRGQTTLAMVDRRRRPRPAGAEPRARGPERRPEPPHGRGDEPRAVLALDRRHGRRVGDGRDPRRGPARRRGHARARRRRRSAAAASSAARAELADAIHPIFLIGVPMMAITLRARGADPRAAAAPRGARRRHPPRGARRGRARARRPLERVRRPALATSGRPAARRSAARSPRTRSRRCR